MTTEIPSKELTTVRLQSPLFQAIEFNPDTVHELLKLGWLVAFEVNAADGSVIGWVRPNLPSTKRRQVKTGQVIVAEQVEDYDDNDEVTGHRTVLAIVDPADYVETYEATTLEIDGCWMPWTTAAGTTAQAPVVDSDQPAEPADAVEH